VRSDPTGRRDSEGVSAALFPLPLSLYIAFAILLRTISHRAVKPSLSQVRTMSVNAPAPDNPELVVRPRHSPF
jgi:hypothetical protein